MKVKFTFFDVRNEFVIEKEEENFTEKEVKDFMFNALTTKTWIVLSELFIYYFFQGKGFIVKKIDPVSSWFNADKNISNYLNKNFSKKTDDTWHEFYTSKGAPDFLVYKKEEGKIIELFFVECKSYAESLSVSQFFWLSKTNVPTKVVFVDYGNVKRLNPKQTKLECVSK